MCEEVILVTSCSANDIEHLSAGWILWYHWLNQRYWMLQPDLDMAWCKVEVVTELQ